MFQETYKENIRNEAEVRKNETKQKSARKTRWKIMINTGSMLNASTEWTC